MGSWFLFKDRLKLRCWTQAVLHMLFPAVQTHRLQHNWTDMMMKEEKRKADAHGRVFINCSSPHVVCWFKCLYGTNKKSFKDSRKLTQHCDTPQGSGLGPVLFSLFFLWVKSAGNMMHMSTSLLTTPTLFTDKTWWNWSSTEATGLLLDTTTWRRWHFLLLNPGKT